MMIAKMKLKSSRSAQLAAAAALMLGTLGVTPLLAQDAGGPPPPPPQQGGEHRPSPAERQQHELDRMTRALSLTPDQVSQVKAIQADSMSKAEAMRGDSTLAPADKHAKMMSMRKEEEAKVRAILTPDQQTKFDTMMARQQEHGGGRRGGPDAPPPPPPSN